MNSVNSEIYTVKYIFSRAVHIPLAHVGLHFHLHVKFKLHTQSISLHVQNVNIYNIINALYYTNIYIQ